MTLVVDCPSCLRKLRVPDDLMGLKVKCPACATVFTASESPAAEAPTPAPSPGPDFEPTPAVLEPTPSTAYDSSQKICPVCRESIPVEARRCRHCGEVFGDEDGAGRESAPRLRRRVRRDAEPHRGTLILVFGILSIVLGLMYVSSLIALPMGIMAWVMGHKDLARMRNHEMDPEGMGTTQAGWICGIVGTIISSLFGLCCIGQIGMFALAVNQGPPPRPAPRPVNQPRPRKFEAPLQGIPQRLPEYFPRVSGNQ
jgi:hypothetical protein